MTNILQSAHINKAKPLELDSFRQKEFAGNITAYKTPWTGREQSFPIESASDLGISEKAFKALQILFPYLDKVFRATGAEFIPQLHSTVANHLNGLEKLCQEIFGDKVRSQLPNELHGKFDEMTKLVRLSLMLHDLPEVPGEISTFCQRLPKTGSVTETERQKLENRVADLLIFHALRIAYEGKGSLAPNVDAAIKESQELTKAMTDSAEKRFHIVKACADKMDTNFDINSIPGFKEDYEQLKQAYYIAEGGCEFETQETFAGNLVKLIDKLESKLHCAVVGDYSIFRMPPAKIIEKEHAQTQGFIKTYKKEKLIQPILDQILKLYEASVRVYREWDNLREPLKPFEKWN